MLPSAPVEPRVTDKWSLGKTSPQRHLLGPHGVSKIPYLVDSLSKLGEISLNKI